MGVRAQNECTYVHALEGVLLCMWACPVKDKVMRAWGELLTWRQPQCTHLIHHGEQAAVKVTEGRACSLLLFHHFTSLYVLSDAALYPPQQNDVYVRHDYVTQEIYTFKYEMGKETRNRLKV